MSKRVKSVSMMIALMGAASMGAMYAEVLPGVDGVRSVQQAGTCTGVVKDATGETVIGASVLVKGTTNGTITGLDGDFSLSGVKKGDIIQISFVGFETQEVAWNGQPLNITLKDDSKQLEEVVVTALGIKKDAKKLGYAVSSVGAGDLIKTASPNLGSALYGKAAGVRIQTAPGGATGSISINVRGLNSITGSNQPLIVIDGVPVRNGDANNSDYWGSQRVQSNGLADINPEDIENLSILKGASASALYGSEGANGVVLITTKTGKGSKGIGVDFNASVTADFVAYMPKYQDKYGKAAPVERRTGSNWTEDGFYKFTDKNGNERIGAQNGTNYWGPAYDGREVYYYDGTMRKYEPQNDNPWNDVFRTGINQQYNLGITKATEHGNMRFSYTYVDNMPTQYNSSYKKHNFSLTGSYNIIDNIKIDYAANYILQDVDNRAYRMSRLVTNFGGMFGAFDDVKYLREHTVTSAGYKNQVYSSATHENPDEGFAYYPSCGALVDEYFWNIMGKKQEENNNRLIASVTPSWEIIKGLTLRTRVATDYTTEKIELKENTTQSNSFGSMSGYYSLQNKRYEIYYFDAMLMLDKQLTEKIGLTANAGWQARQESYFVSGVSTNGGLTVENWFHINASKNTPNSSMTKQEFLKTAFLGTASLAYSNWGYLEGTIRSEKISTLAKGNNSFVYPSANASVVFSELFGEKKPTWFDYGKVRASFGIVGNAPEIYKATQAYNQNTAGGYIYNQIPTSVGNNAIKPEKKYEWEFGLEGKFFGNRLGFEASYYTNTVKDQILQTTMPMSSGGGSILMNIGELQNSGLEFSVYGTLVDTKDWHLDLRGNISFNKNKVTKLNDGVDYIQHSNWDNGSMYLRSYVGQSMGDFYALAPAKNEKGEYIIGSNGLYKLTDDWVKVGNAMPKATGGFAASLGYKNFFVDASLDFRIGGDVFNMPYQYMMGRGALEETLWAHDGEGKGLTYYLNSNMECVPYNGTVGPNGERIHDNGIILEGVDENGNKNTKMIGADKLMNWTYNWGGYDPSDVTYYSHSSFSNDYVKLRELTIGYNFPKSITEKFHCKSLQLSVYGRNLFYFYKNLPIFDAEATDGTSWVSQSWIGGSTATTRSFGFSLRASF
ncbi:MAG: SusC/RagA family TonB-linked outer membrane protein [Phocaeicola plebeius]|nr:SusC/RagA family TonB-linked outer membrane protein [Phocaeicola plebeius]